jgi:hypothetical protein
MLEIEAEVAVIPVTPNDPIFVILYVPASKFPCNGPLEASNFKYLASAAASLSGDISAHVADDSTYT